MQDQGNREPDRTMTRLFLTIGALLALFAAAASMALRSWWPLGAMGLVVGGVMVLSLAELAFLKPLSRLVMRAGERAPSAPSPAETSQARPRRPRAWHVFLIVLLEAVVIASAFLLGWTFRTS